MRNKIKYLTNDIEEQMLLSNIVDKLEIVVNENYIKATDFLSPREMLLTDKLLNEKTVPRYLFWGGSENSQRNICIILPDYFDKEIENIEDEGFLSYLRIILPKGYKLRHSDYLGAILSLGIERKLIGDIFVHDEGADLVCVSRIKDFIISNFHKANRVGVKIENLSSYKHIKSSTLKFEEKTIYVPSLRIDAYLSSAYGLSRAKAIEFIEKRLVSINTEIVLKNTKNIKEGDIVNIRRLKKTTVSKIIGKTKKDNIILDIKIWK